MSQSPASSTISDARMSSFYTSAAIEKDPPCVRAAANVLNRQQASAPSHPHLPT
jgi:hypothetical protein